MPIEHPTKHNQNLANELVITDPPSLYPLLTTSLLNNSCLVPNLHLPVDAPKIIQHEVRLSLGAAPRIPSNNKSRKEEVWPSEVTSKMTISSLKHWIEAMPAFGSFLYRFQRVVAFSVPFWWLLLHHVCSCMWYLTAIPFHSFNWWVRLNNSKIGCCM